MRRFERIYDVVEPVEEYRAGGYHPVHLNDLFQGRYQIVGKLAFGQFSTVWLAKNQQLQRFVTLKILKADASKHSRELLVLLHLSKSDQCHPGRDHVVQLLNHFEHEGPNGLHLCLVLPVMVSDGEAMTIRERPRYASYIREVSRQILLGLDSLHGRCLIHGDLQQANILFSVDCDPSTGILMEPDSSTVNWLPGVEADNSAPRYLVTSQRPRGVLDNIAISKLTVKLGDLGGVAMWIGQYDFLPVTPTALRAPELLQGCSWNEKIDIWALVCLIFQLATNEPLFPLESFGCTVDEVHGKLVSLIHNLIENGSKKFAAYISERLPRYFGTENVEQLAQFLWSMLQETPQDRKPTALVLDHPFIGGPKGCLDTSSISR